MSGTFGSPKTRIHCPSWSSNVSLPRYYFTLSKSNIKGGLISQGTYFNFGPIANYRCQITPLSRKFKYLKLFSVMGRKFKFVGNGTKFKIPSEIKPPL